jgi:hypothetical protein
MKQNETNLSPKNPKYFCECCKYITNNKKDYKKHLMTSKHQNETNETNLKHLLPNNPQNLQCHCGIIFNSRSTLWRHKKKCNEENKEEPSDKELIMMLIKENSELKNMMLKVLENGTNSYNNNNNIQHSNNKTFNLQVFLNETCKDAMNISEFIENISLQLSDLENMGKLGYVDGVSNIIIKNLNALDVTQRPLHCTDKKRDIVYVKDDDEWLKEQEDKKHLKSVISSVVSKNLKLLPEYEDKYPECMNPESKKSDEYNKIIMETIGGGSDVVERNKEKVIRKVAKSVTIDKID